MLTGSYRKRLETDLTRWVGEGLVSRESATAIRQSLAREAGFKLPALLGLFGGLLIASSVAAFVAANWEEMPRLAKLGMILIGVAGALLIAARLEAKGSSFGADSAATCGVLIFAAGIALVGQMYHLPSDWPAGSLLIALGALVVALLLRSDGALIIALVGIVAWTIGRWDEAEGAAQLAFFAFYLPALWLALARSNRFVHHAAVLALAVWLALLPGNWMNDHFDYGLIAYLLAMSTLYVALGAASFDRGGPALVTCCLPWGLAGLMVALSVELFRILDGSQAAAGTAIWLNYASYGLAVPTAVLLGAVGRDRRFTWPLSAALLMALLVPAVFLTGRVVSLPGKIAVASLILMIAIALVAAGAAGGVRRLTLAGSGLFGLSILILLWETISTLLDQSLFFLVAGLVLLSLAGWARKLFARFSRAESEPKQPEPKQPEPKP